MLIWLIDLTVDWLKDWTSASTYRSAFTFNVPTLCNYTIYLPTQCFYLGFISIVVCFICVFHDTKQCVVILPVYKSVSIIKHKLCLTWWFRFSAAFPPVQFSFQLNHTFEGEVRSCRRDNNHSLSFLCSIFLNWKLLFICWANFKTKLQTLLRP